MDEDTDDEDDDDNDDDDEEEQDIGTVECKCDRDHIISYHT